MIEVAIFLDLPRFPDITEDCYLHPNVLCMKYLLEFNLPGELWCAGEEGRRYLHHLLSRTEGPFFQLQTTQAT